MRRLSLFKSPSSKEDESLVSEEYNQIVRRSPRNNTSPRGTETNNNTILHNTTTLFVLFGCSDSGKSTVRKNIYNSFVKELSVADRINSQSLIFSNIILGVKLIVEGIHKYHLQYNNLENERIGNEVLNQWNNGMVLNPLRVWNVEFVDKIIKLSSDSSFKLTLQKKNELQVFENLDYFIQNLDRMKNIERYIPSEKDILYAMSRTVGYLEFEFDFFGRKKRMIDLGGTRMERKKLGKTNIYQLEENMAMIFFINLSEFDKNLWEDGTTNRLSESLQLFTKLSLQFKDKRQIILFTKVDELKTKIENGCKFSDYIPEFKGDNTNIKEIFYFILNLFSEKYKGKDRLEYHAINALNRAEVKQFITNVIERKGNLISNLIETKLEWTKFKLNESFHLGQLCDIDFTMDNNTL
ncbi:hypothetical protein ABK040_005123 [Willaertia magna]